MDIADIVVSLCGRDECKRFFVVGVEGEYALLADGKTRRIEKPKHKKIKHLEPLEASETRAAEKLRNNEKVTNIEIRRALAIGQGGGGEKGVSN